MKNRPETIERAVQTISASRHLERIGDHATNIAEDIVYMVEGEVIRHSQAQQPRAEVRDGPRPSALS
jgi:phosphate transport system protein